MFVRKLNELFHRVTIYKGLAIERTLSDLNWQLDEEKDHHGNNQYSVILSGVSIDDVYDLGSEISAQLGTFDYTDVKLVKTNTYKLLISEDILKSLSAMKEPVKTNAEKKSDIPTPIVSEPKAKSSLIEVTHSDHFNVNNLSVFRVTPTILPPVNIANEPKKHKIF
ncbi:MAG: hypothetical protein ACYCQI_07440 [Gammaproteobacteria bacterium]